MGSETSAQSRVSALMAQARVPLLILVFSAGLAMGFHRIEHRDLWLDETFTVINAQNSVGTIVGMSGQGAETLPPAPAPLGYLVAKPFANACGNSERCLRAPYPFFFAGTAVLMVLIGEALFGLWAGLFAALFWITFPVALMHAQEVRFYAMLPFFSMATVALTTRCLRVVDGRAAPLWMFAAAGLCAAATVWSQLAGALWLAPFGLWAIAMQALALRQGTAHPAWKRGWKVALLAGAVGLAPLLPGLLGQTGDTGEDAAGYAKFSFGAIDNWAERAEMMVGLNIDWQGMLALFGVGIAAAGRHRVNLLSLLALAAFPLLLFGVIEPSRPVYERYLVQFNATMVLCVGASLASIALLPLRFVQGRAASVAPAGRKSSKRKGKRKGKKASKRVEQDGGAQAVATLPAGDRWAALAVGAALVLAAVVPMGRVQAANLQEYWDDPGFHPWRKVTDFLNDNVRDGDALVITPGRLLSFPFRVYPPSLEPIHGDDDDLPEAIRSRKYQRVWLVASHHTIKRKPWRKVEFDGLMRQLSMRYRRDMSVQRKWGVIYIRLFELPTRGRSRR
jgi:hypothetical protein